MTAFQNLKKPSLFQNILDSLIDGILILNDRGEWIDANTRGEQICRQFLTEKSPVCSVPQEIWRICQTLLGFHALPSRQSIVVEDEITTDQSNALRIRARWIDYDAAQNPCMLVMLENRFQSNQAVAIAEAQKYELTPRESEVWQLHRQGYTYKEIAAALYISLNTVKKHMKGIYAKRQVIEAEE
jgi:DNA-binding CsgD family transcriptional regulator